MIIDNIISLLRSILHRFSIFHLNLRDILSFFSFWDWKITVHQCGAWTRLAMKVNLISSWWYSQCKHGKRTVRLWIWKVTKLMWIEYFVLTHCSFHSVQSMRSWHQRVWGIFTSVCTCHIWHYVYVFCTVLIKCGLKQKGKQLIYCQIAHEVTWSVLYNRQEKWFPLH